MADDEKGEPAEESTPPVAAVPPVEDPGYTPSGVPTFDSVREKIETRFGTAIGGQELTAETPEGRSAEQRYEERQKAALRAGRFAGAGTRADRISARNFPV